MTSTHKHHIISIQYPPHKCLPGKSCLHCLRILIMSWLFKDPINSGLAQFRPCPTSSKICQKDQIAPNEFFSRKKKLIKCSCTYWPLSFCKMFKQFLEPIQDYEDMSFAGSAQNIVLNKMFLVQIIIITFIYLLVLFIVQNFKNFYCGSTVMRMRMVLLPKTIFLGKLLI